MDDDLFLISDIENEYKKLGVDVKKKYPRLKDMIDLVLKTIEEIKAPITSTLVNATISEVKQKFESDLHLSMDIIIKPIMIISDNKYSKFYFSCILILKKLITYNFITENEYNKIIKMLKEMFDNSNEDTQLKILEALQSLISINVTKINEETLNNIMSIFCRIFCFKSIETKNALQLILGTFMKKIFDYVDNNAVINLIKNLVLLSEGIKKDWINSPSVGSKCFGLELITIIVETFPDKLKNEIFKPVLNEDVKILIQKIFAMNMDQPIICIKVCRLTVAIINNLNILYELIEPILKMITKNNEIPNAWQKILGLECLVELFKNPKFLEKLYINYKFLYEKMLLTFSDVTYKSFTIKTKNLGVVGEIAAAGVIANIPYLRKQAEINNKIPNKKYLSNNFLITDENISFTQNVNYIQKLLTECFVNLRNSFIILLEENNVNVNVNTLVKIKKEQKEKKNTEIIFNEKQKQLQEMISTQFVNIKGGLIGILINVNDISVVQTFISIFQTYIYIFTSFNLETQRNELLDDLCKLAIPNNLENIFEVKEKNILIIRSIFNIIHCINLLDYNSWMILLETIQNLYFILIKSNSYLYDYKDQFNINLIMNNLLNNIQKYSFNADISDIQKLILDTDDPTQNNNAPSLPILNTQTVPIKENKYKRASSGIINISNKQQQQLTEEQKENVEILSNVVNNLFIESNDYDNDTLLTIAKALYDTIKQKFDNYIKLKKENKKSIRDSINLVNSNSIMSIMSITNKDQEKNLTQITNKDLIKENEIAKINANISAIGNLNANSNSISATNTMNTNMLIQNNQKNELLLSNITFINFNLVKLLHISIININRIDLLWKILTDTANLLSSNSINNRFSNTLSKFTIEILIQIIIIILSKYNKKDNNQSFNEKEIQVTIFKPVYTLLNRHHNISFALQPLRKIIEKSGLKLNNIGWNSYINILNEILSNEKVDSQQCESVFKIIEHIFNEYLIYLNVFNIDHLLNVLEKFSVSKDNNNICYSSISYFWQCADICENYQKSKKVLNKEVLELFDQIKLNTDEEKNLFYGNLWKNIFYKLININNDERFDIKKSGINVFSQFFVAKIKSMNILYDTVNNRKISAEVIYEIFFEIISKNFKIFSNNINNKDQKEFSELENTVVISLQAIGKVIKCYIEENKTDNDNNKIFTLLIEKCLELIKNCTPLIGINVLKTLIDIESIDDKILFENLDLNWKILNGVGNFIVDENLFVKKYADTVDGEKLVESIIDALRNFYYKKNFDDENIFNNEVEKLIIYYPKIFMGVNYTEEKFIKANPSVLIEFEENLFELIDYAGLKIKNDTLVLALKYLISFINFDLKHKHSEILCKRSTEVFSNIIKNNKNIHLIEKEKLSRIILDFINMSSPIITSIKNDEVINYIKNKKDKNKFIWNFLIEELLYNIIDPTIFDLTSQIVWDKIENLFNDIIKINSNLQKKLLEYTNICQKMETTVVNFIINCLLPKSFFIGKESKYYSLFENNISENENILSIDKLCLGSLFDICKLKSKDEINKSFKENADYLKNDEKNFSDEEIAKMANKYVEMKINLTKKSMPILLKKCESELKNFLDNNEKEDDKENIKYILMCLKNMDYTYDDSNNDKDLMEKSNNLIMKECLKSKKGHLFLMHALFSEYISIKDSDIKVLIKEIFQEMSKEMGLK